MGNIKLQNHTMENLEQLIGFMDSISNGNAYIRNIVLHAYECVPEKETHHIPICNSRGCPMTSPHFLKQLMPIIDSFKQPLFP
jgi:hypothetical protein